MYIIIALQICNADKLLLHYLHQFEVLCVRDGYIFLVSFSDINTHTHTHRNRVDHLESITDALISTLGLIYLEKQWIYPLYLFKKYRFTILPDSWYESFSLTLQNASSFHNETVARPHIQTLLILLDY